MKSSAWSVTFQVFTILCLGLIAYQLYRLEVKTTRTNKFILEALQDAKKGGLDVVHEDDILIGDPDAPGTIIMYSQPDCEYCRDFLVNQFKDVRQQLVDTRKAKFVLRFLTHLKDSTDVAAVKKAYCLGGDDYLQSLEIPGKAMTPAVNDSCLQSNAPGSYIVQSATQAREAGIRLTPYFIVNGNHMTGIKNLAKFEDLLTE